MAPSTWPVKVKRLAQYGQHLKAAQGCKEARKMSKASGVSPPRVWSCLCVQCSMQTHDVPCSRPHASPSFHWCAPQVWNQQGSFITASLLIKLLWSMQKIKASSSVRCWETNSEKKKEHCCRSPTSCSKLSPRPFFCTSCTIEWNPGVNSTSPHPQQVQNCLCRRDLHQVPVRRPTGGVGKELVGGAKLGPVLSLLGCLHNRHLINVLPL